MVDQYLWFALFASLAIVYFIVLLKARNKRKYLAYFISGAIIGFVLDFVGVGQSYYHYYPFYGPIISGIPLSVTVAEGFAVAITICLFEFIRERLEN